MKLAQVLLWLLFLFLTGKKIQSFHHESEPEAAISIKTLAQTNLVNLTNRPSPSPSFEAPLPASSSTLSSKKITDKAWPSLAKLSLPTHLSLPQAASDKQTTPNESWAYRSQNFEFTSTAPLRDSVVREFSALFELSHLYCSRLPFELARMGTKRHQPLEVLLFEDYPDYLREGGAPGSGGTYLNESDLILVPFEGLGLRKENEGYSLNEHRSNQTLMHEVTHMMMRGPLLKDGWFVEGAAEYVATIPTKKDSLLLESHLESVISYVSSYGFNSGGGHNLGKEIELAPVKTLLECDYHQFQNLENGYPYSLLIFYYFAHFDGKSDSARLKAYAQALNTGSDSQSAQSRLLANRDYDSLESEIAKAWSKHGLTLAFRRPQQFAPIALQEEQPALPEETQFSLHLQK